MQADKVDIDTKTGQSIYHGHVVFQRGTTRIQAEEVHLKSAHDGEISYALATGNKAHYQTRPAKNKALLKASAKQIRYDGAQQKVTLTGDALVQQEKNTLRAPVIIYHIKTGKLETKSTAKQRTVIRLFPDKKPQVRSIL